MDRYDVPIVRQTRLSDLGAVRELIHHTIDVSYHGFYPPRAIQFFKEFHSETAILNRHRYGGILVAEKDGSLTGTGALMGAEILGVFVHPDFQRFGFGRNIMDALEQKAVSRGAGEIELSVSLPSRKFYETLGYDIIAGCTVDVGNGEQLNYWQARKLLRQDIRKPGSEGR